MTGYAELQCTSHFSFLRGASSCEQLFAQAAHYGVKALAITDRNSIAGIVRAHACAKHTGVRLIVGCRLDLMDGTSILVYPTNKDAYSRLCRLLSLGKRRAGKGECHLTWDDLPDYAEGLIAILVPEEPDDTCKEQLQKLNACFGKDAFLALTLRRRPRDTMRLYRLSELAHELDVLPVVTNDVL
ncbi:MAG: PHP domain-containing protein [Rickettsiales bacterium]